MRKPSLSKTIIEGLEVLATNPCAAEVITEVKRYNITQSEILKAQRAYEWIQRMKQYRIANDAGACNQKVSDVTTG